MFGSDSSQFKDILSDVREESSLSTLLKSSKSKARESAKEGTKKDKSKTRTKKDQTDKSLKNDSKSKLESIRGEIPQIDMDVTAGMGRETEGLIKSEIQSMKKLDQLSENKLPKTTKNSMIDDKDKANMKEKSRKSKIKTRTGSKYNTEQSHDLGIQEKEMNEFKIDKSNTTVNSSEQLSIRTSFNQPSIEVRRLGGLRKTKEE